MALLTVSQLLDNVPNRTNRIVGKILLRTIRYQTLFFFQCKSTNIVVQSTRKVGVDGG